MKATCTFPDRTKVEVVPLVLKQPYDSDSTEPCQVCVEYVSEQGLKMTVWVPVEWVQFE